MNNALELLAAMPIFGALNETSLRLLTREAELVERGEGEHFFLENDDTHDLFVLQSGDVEIYKNWRGEARVLARMKRGDCFGEMSLIDLMPRSASALAVAQCEALKISPPALHKLYVSDLEQFTLLQMNMSRELSRRMRAIDDLLFRALMGDTLPESGFIHLR